MTPPMYKLYVSSVSPYSSKASALLGYAEIPARVAEENLVNRYSVLKRLTGDTMVPVLRRENWAINDSSHIARWAQGRADRELLPEAPAVRSVCWLIEEFADEWISRWVTHSRWHNPEDARAVAAEIGDEVTCGWPLVGRPVGHLTSSMIRRGLEHGGVRESNRTALEQSRDRVMQGLENILDAVDGYLFGEAPTVADFAMYGQLGQYRRDPTGGRRMQMYPAIDEWLDDLDRMRLPHPVVAHRRGGSPELSDLQVVFGELFGTYWRVLVAVHRARAEGDPPDAIGVEMVDGTTFEIGPSRYVASRLDFVVEHLDRLRRKGPELLGSDVLQIDEAIDRAVGDLREYAAGRRLIEKYGGLG